MSDTPPSPLEALLRCCAAAAPQPWFPRADPRLAGVPWSAVAAQLELLYLEGLIRKAAASPEAGPGFVPTEAGVRVLHDPTALERLRTAGTAAPPGDRGAIVRDALRNPRPPAVARLLLLANLAVFGYGVYLAAPAAPAVQNFLAGPSLATGRIDLRTLDLLHHSGGLRGADLVRGEWWRLVTSGFVHGGLPHLLMNMWVLYAASRLVESMWGHWRYFLLYVVSLLGGSCVGVAERPEVLGVGASGALCGLIASEAVWLALNGRYLPRSLVARWRGGLVATFLLLVFISLFPGVSGWGHLGGAVAGVLAAVLLNYQRFGPSPWRWLALAGLPLIVAGGVAFIDRQRTAAPSWHAVEQRVFEDDYLPRVQRAVRQAAQVYQERAESLLSRHPTRRDAEAVAAAVPVLEQERQQLAELSDALGRAGPYRDPLTEEARRAGRAYVDGWAELLGRAAEALRARADEAAAAEQAVRQQRAALAELRAAWRRVLGPK